MLEPLNLTFAIALLVRRYGATMQRSLEAHVTQRFRNKASSIPSWFLSTIIIDFPMMSSPPSPLPSFSSLNLSGLREALCAVGCRVVQDAIEARPPNPTPSVEGSQALWGPPARSSTQLSPEFSILPQVFKEIPSPTPTPTPTTTTMTAGGAPTSLNPCGVPLPVKQVLRFDFDC
jgi:hypothetical protein